MASRIHRETDIGAPLLWPALRPAAEPAARSEKPSPEAEFARKLAEVEQQAERRVREARQAGLKEGEQAGRRAAEGELRTTIEKLAAAIHEAAALRPGVMARAEAIMVKLAIAIARRVLHRELSVDPDALQALVHLLLQKVQVQEVLRVRIYPEHQAMLRAALERLPGGSQVEIRADPGLGRGGVVFETTRGALDASVDTQLSEVERGLADRLHRETS